MLTAIARITVLKTNDSTPWTKVRRRRPELDTCTSETWQVMPTTKP